METKAAFDEAEKLKVPGLKNPQHSKEQFWS